MKKLLLMLLVLSGLAMAQTSVKIPSTSSNNVWTGTNSFPGVTITGTPSANTDAATVSYVQSHGGAINTYTLATLPGSAGEGTIVNVTDGARGPYVYKNGQWRPLGNSVSVLDFGASGNSGYYPNCGMSSGSHNVSINAVWKRGNMTAGTRIVIQGAGPAGADLDTTITSVSGGTITVAAAASTTVSGGGVWWGTDDTPALQAAITYLHNIGGGTVSLPENGGDYIITNVTVPAIDNTVSLKQGGISIQCAGRRTGAVIVGAGADQVGMIQVAANSHATEIRGCNFAGFSDSTTSLRHPIAIDVQGGTQHRITDNYFDDALFNGIQMTSTFNDLIDFNKFQGPYDSCIKFVSGASAVIDTRIRDNEFEVCGASHTHGYALEQISAGGGGSNALIISGNDCEGTEWNGCWLLKNVSDYVLENNRTEVDTAIADGTFSVLYNQGSSGVARNNNLSGGNTMDGGSVVLYSNDIFHNSFGCGLTYTANGGSVTIIGSGPISNITRSDLCGSSSFTNATVFIDHVEGFLNSNGQHIFWGNGPSAEPSNVRKLQFHDMRGSTGGNAVGWGSTVQGAPNNTAAERTPLVSAGASFLSGDRLYNSYWPGNGAENGAWVCSSATCSTTDGTTWTGTWYYLNYDKFIRSWGTTAPASGYYAAGDQQYNSSWDGTSGTVYKWLCTASGSPGTWKAIYLIDPASPGTLGATLPAAATFSTLTTNNGVFAKAPSGTPDTVTCGGSCSLAWWFKADSLALSDGANATSLTDSSSGAHNATCVSTFPIYKTNIFNGKPIVRFVHGTSNACTTSTFSITGSYTIFIVAAHPTGEATFNMLVSGAGGDHIAYPNGTVSATSLRSSNNNGSAGYPFFQVSEGTDDAKPHVLSAIMQLGANGASLIARDGTTLSSSSSATSLLNFLSSQALVVSNSPGSGFGYDGDIAEIVIFQGALDILSRQQVETYLGLKYDIPAAEQKAIVVQGTGGATVAQFDGNGKMAAAGASTGLSTVTFSATPTFDAFNANTFKTTLTGNVTSSTLANAVAGQNLHFIICQDATGSRTFVWPTNVLGGMTIGATLSKCSAQSFMFDGTNAYATSPGVTNQ